MSTYVRKTKHQLAKCDRKRCKWARIFWELQQAPPWTATKRAAQAVVTHKRRAH